MSIWLDMMSRDLLRTGEFAALVADSAVTGATSNPTIFAKAITGSDRYDDQLRALAATGFISFECTPDVADDAEATIAQALDLRHRLDLPNVMIKVRGAADQHRRQAGRAI